MENKICFYTSPYPHIKSYFDMIDCAVHHGLSAVEGFCHFELEFPDKAAAKKIREYADAKGVNFPCFSVFINLVGDDSDEMLEMLKGFADVTAILGAPYLHHTIVNNFYNPDEVLDKKEENYQKGLAAVREIYDYAEKIGVKTVYEDQGYIFNGVEGFGRFLKEVNRDVGVVADFGNIYQVGESAEEFVKTFGHRVSHAHIKNIVIKDCNDTGEGLKTLQGKFMFEEELEKGCVDCEKIIRLLKEKGYNGYYGLEFSAKQDESAYMKESIYKINCWLD